ncbi:hypothetical protein BCR42DRAFT_385896 [Absidia repens]|uniref:F-box domain-containing protein n=1 Tax=Absidia repens TaxID=90262 RepID=A0A1X2J092_9FUNG|nr:hypothetical protein BCR42DRAFT_385896 [Absidia repens]
MSADCGMGMVPLFRLSNELIIRMLSFLDHSNTILEFLVSHSSFYNQFYDDDDFWRDLCSHHYVTYRSPSTSWRQFVLSQEMYYTCPHLTMSLFQTLVQKQELAFLPSASLDHTSYRCICLYPHCHSIDEENHFHLCSHSVGLQISLFHIFTLQCYSCGRSIGDDGRLLGEKWLTQTLIRAITSPMGKTSFDLAKELFQCRRLIEISLFNRPGWSYIVEKSWYDEWPPGQLNNKILQKEDTKGLICTLKIGTDFELVNNASRYCIERLYGLSGMILSEYDLQTDVSYCQLLHGIHLFQQRARFRPPIIHL